MSNENSCHEEKVEDKVLRGKYCFHLWIVIGVLLSILRIMNKYRKLLDEYQILFVSKKVILKSYFAFKDINKLFEVSIRKH